MTTTTTTDSSLPRAARHPKPALVLGFLALAGVVFAMLQSLVAPALPVIAHELNASTADISWLVTAYLLAAAVSTPIAGRLGDMFGKRRVLLIVLGLLAAGTLVAALAGNLAVLIAGRVLQGAGGAVLPLAFGIVRDELLHLRRRRPPRARPRQRPGGRPGAGEPRLDHPAGSAFPVVHPTRPATPGRAVEDDQPPTARRWCPTDTDERKTFPTTRATDPDSNTATPHPHQQP